MIQGLSPSEVTKLRQRYGPNTLYDTDSRSNLLFALLSRFKNPLVVVLLIAATFSLFFGNPTNFFIIVTIVIVSVSLDFMNTYRSQRAAEALREKVRVKAQVMRGGISHMVAVEALVPGDVVQLAAGKIIPADGVVIEGKDLFTNEAALTGESFPQSKPLESEVFMGSGVVSGKGYMRVTTTGKETKFAHIASTLRSTRRVTEFEKEIKAFSILVVKVTFFLVIFVFLVNIVFHRDVIESILFSLALAVGLAPELLPLVITLNLAKGSLQMAKEGVIVKQLSAVQNFGSMDVLCTDKTGTLTEDKIELVKYVDGKNNPSDEVLRLGYLASVFSTSFQNPLDDAVEARKPVNIADYRKIDEIPFDFERKREAVVVHHVHEERRFLIVKGAPEEIFKISTKYGKSSFDGQARKAAESTYVELSRSGFRVLAIASKEIEPEKHYESGSEKELTFQGFLAFLDPAKTSVSETFARMREMGISAKVITGDNLFVTQKIASDVGLPVVGTLTGDELDRLSQAELVTAVRRTTIFARVNPEQKVRIIQALQAGGHVVGYLGDGINDAPSLRAADASVSVNNAVDVAKDAADFILLHKSLHELINGVVEGRKTFANTLKYLRMELSSNFGNMFSMAGASLFLPFLPMLATQILLNNLLYDASQFAISFDNVDKREVTRPHTLSIKGIKRFMWSYGLLSSFFDFAVFGLLLLVFHADASVFQAGWFLESILTQIFVVFIIRTRLTPFKDSKPAPLLIASTLAVAIIATLVVLLPIRSIFQFGELQFAQIAALLGIVVTYLFFAQVIKKKFYAV